MQAAKFEAGSVGTKDSCTDDHIAEDDGSILQTWGRGCGHSVFQASRGLGSAHNYSDFDIAENHHTSQLLGRVFVRLDPWLQHY